jgi:hypothetical protein
MLEIQKNPKKTFKFEEAKDWSHMHPYKKIHFQVDFSRKNSCMFGADR